MQREMWIEVDNVYVYGVNEMLYSQLCREELNKSSSVANKKAVAIREGNAED